MRLRLGLVGGLAASFITFAIGMQAIYHFSGRSIRDEAFRAQEYDRIIAIALQIEPRIRQEEWHTRLTAVDMARQLESSQRIHSKLEREHFTALRDVIQSAQIDQIETTDDVGNVVFQDRGAAGEGERSRHWGIEEALQGKPTTTAVSVREGALILHTEPVRQGTRIVGTLTAGRRIASPFITAMKQDFGVDVALISRDGEMTVATTNPGMATAIEVSAINEAFTQKIPTYRTDLQRRTTQVYFPLQIVDDAWVLVAEIDSSAAIAAHNRHDLIETLVTLVSMGLSVLATLLILKIALRPLRTLRAHSGALYLDLTGRQLPASKGDDDIDNLVHVLNTLTDLLMQRNTELSRQRTDLRISSKAFETQQPTVVTDPGGTILKINRAYTNMSGYFGEEMVGRIIDILNPELCPDRSLNIRETLDKTGHWHGDTESRRKSGDEYPQKVSIHAVQDEGGTTTHLILTFLDVSAYRGISNKLRELTLFDALTRLPNRNSLIERLQEKACLSHGGLSFKSLIAIDLDHFKSLNDTQGHQAGDLLIRMIGERLSASVRSQDTVARIGGDEFAIILEGLADSAEEALADTRAVCRKIQAKFCDSFDLNGTDYHCTCSIGVTLFGMRETTADALLMQADLALHKAKERGRNTICFFDQSMHESVIERVSLEKDLKLALDQHQFMAYFQPQVTEKGVVIGAEALIRWNHPERGIVSPRSFIPLAEETGEIIAIGRWLLELTCDQLQRWSSVEELSHVTIAINVCARQLHHFGFVDQVLTALDRSGADPTRLKLEITESMLVEHSEELIRRMEALRNRGIGLSLDDFGTGYSSLSYLKRLPIEQLKIDQSFVRDIMTDPNDAAIARTIVGLAQNLGLSVIAEGVETSDQRDFLLSVGCTTYQGYFYSKPLTLPEFETFVRKRNTRRTAGS